MQTDWNQAVALITGASSGIGLATARAFTARGAKVALVARTRANLEAVVSELGGDRAASFPLDVTDRAALAELPRRVVERFGRLDIVVNNAGVNHRGAVTERDIRELEEIVDTNLTSPIRLTHASLPLLGRGGVVVNVASLAGKVAVPHEATYCASKAGLRAFARALSVELAEQGIRVATVCPGPVDTGFLGELKDVPDLVFSQPMSSAEEIAAAVVRVVETDEVEVDVPVLSGKLATLGYLLPPVFKTLRPLFERLGARKKARFIEHRRGQRPGAA
jgi:short-subunit dehydrogenase